MREQDLIDQMSSAIAEYEGFHLTEEECRRRKLRYPTVAQRHNNPGNLRTWPKVKTVDGYAQFPTVEAGWQALKAQIRLNIARGLTIEEFFAGKKGVYPGYAPASDNNHPVTYAWFVADRLARPGYHLSSDTVIKELIDA